MALKKYAYYVKGNRIALVQMDTTDISAEDYGKYKSPTESVLDGMEVEYTYSPVYNFISAAKVTCDLISMAAGGYVNITDLENTLPTSGITHVVIKESEHYNGLHEVKDFDSSGNTITLKTKFKPESQITPDVDSSGFKVYTNVEVMQDEDFDIDITRYQAQAVTYYLKAKMSEEAMDIEGREYWMRLFNKQLEKGANSRKYGPRIIQGFGGRTNE